MTFLVLLYADESATNALTREEKMAIVEGHLAFRAAADTAGILSGGHPLADAAEVVTVRSADALRTDGPFLETKEQIGGYYLLDCPSVEVAVEWAGRIPPAPGQVVELRPTVG